jgi:hypothetical protein
MLMGWTPVDLLVPDVDVYRLGNASSSKIDVLRPGEATIETRDGIPFIIADGTGVSLYDRDGLEIAGLTGHVYLLKAGVYLPAGLRLHNDFEHHYNLAPIFDMKLEDFIGLCRMLAPLLTFAFKRK